MDYAKLAETAKRLIEKNGRGVTLIKKSETPADADKPWRGSDGNDTSVDAVAVMLAATFADTSLDTARRARQRAIVAAASVEGTDLRDFDRLVDGSDVWKIDWVNEITPGDTRLLWFVDLKR